MNRKNSITIVEPTRGKNIMLGLNNRMVKHDLLVMLIPFTADVFVFTYPVYLVGLYLWGIGKKNDYYKEAALGIFFSAGMAAVVNIVIQFFGEKARPELLVSNKENLILSHLPSDPFPSDHAAVSAAIAMATLLRGLRHKDKAFMRLSIFFWIASLLMSFSRITAAIHRPTDIIVGIGVGVISALIIFSKPIWMWLKRHIIRPIIRFEKRLFKSVFGVVQE